MTRALLLLDNQSGGGSALTPPCTTRAARVARSCALALAHSHRPLRTHPHCSSIAPIVNRISLSHGCVHCHNARSRAGVSRTTTVSRSTTNSIKSALLLPISSSQACSCRTRSTCTAPSPSQASRTAASTRIGGPHRVRRRRSRPALHAASLRHQGSSSFVPPTPERALEWRRVHFSGFSQIVKVASRIIK